MFFITLLEKIVKPWKGVLFPLCRDEHREKFLKNMYEGAEFTTQEKKGTCISILAVTFCNCMAW